MRNQPFLSLLITIFLLSIPSFLYAASVQLSWQANPESDLQSYNVYYGTQTRSYGPPIPVGNGTSYTLSGLEEGGTYFFAVSAVDTSGNESGYSEEISKQIASSDSQPPVISITSPTSDSTYSVSIDSISLAGTASDDQELDLVTWTNSNGSSGTASGTTTWSIDNIDLIEGDNIITVTATGSSGDTAQDTLRVTFTPSSTVVGLPVNKVTSSGDDGNVAANTIDNDLSTRWSASGSGQWIQYDLGADFDISKVMIAFFVGDTREADLEVFVSRDAQSWNSVFKGSSSGSTLHQESYALSNATGRYLRIVGYGNSSNDWNSITEVDIVGVAANSPDVTAPTVSILSPASSGSYQSDQATLSVSGSAQDEGGVAEVRWESSAGQSGTASGTTDWSVSGIALQEGTNTITVTAVDAAGNAGTDTLTVTYTAPDTTRPEVAITSPVSVDTYTAQTATIALAGTAGDDSGIAEVRWESSTGQSGTASGTTDWSVSGVALQEGTNTITVTATDSAGNTAQDTLTVTYTALDYDLMVSATRDLSNAAPLAGQTVSGTIYVFLTPEDQVAEVAFALDGQATRVERQAPFELGYSDTTTLANGNHTASGRITLQDGSTQTVSAAFTVQNEVIPPPDETAPSVSILSPTSGDSYQAEQATLTLSGSARDEGGIDQVSWSTSTGQSGTASGTTEWSVSGITLQEGTNTINVTALDAAGNAGTDTLTVTYTAPDTTNPEVAITSPVTTGSYTSQTATINLAGTAGDDSGIAQIAWSSSNGDSGIAAGTATWSVSGINLASGETVITVTATDGAGNTTSEAFTVTYAPAPVDTTAPTVQITLPTTKGFYFSRTSSVNIGGTAGDDTTLTQVIWQNSRGDSGVCNGTSQWQATGIPLDRFWNTITITAVDKAGNTNVKELRVFRWR